MSGQKSRLEDIRILRLQKLEKLRQMGINPYPSKYSQVRTLISDTRNRLGEKFNIVGRLWRWREHGNLIFADLRDESGQIQLMFQKKKLVDHWPLIKLLDSGDYLGVSGVIISTQAGEITLEVESLELVSKSIRPLPDDWHGLTDEETRYRQRYVDILLKPDLKELFRKKSVFWNTIRSFLTTKGFLEVETPVLENTAGGADAEAFVTHHNALDIDLFLRISMGELWQKRLMVAGFEKTFEIGRQFRNEGISREHLQDYTQMEFYWAHANYLDGMKLVEEMYKKIAIETFATLKFSINGHSVDLEQPWQQIDYRQTILEKTGTDIAVADESVLRQALSSRQIKFDPKVDGRGRLIDLLWKSIRKQISGPVFLTGHPVEVSPLAKRQSDTPQFVEKYQIILGGSEMGNGYSELNDPVDQKQRLLHQQQMRQSGDTEAQMYDSDYIRALEYGMPPVTGFGVSERLFSFLADLPIRETVIFPLLRPETNS